MSSEMPSLKYVWKCCACWASSCYRCMSTLKPDSEWRESSPFSCCSLSLSVSVTLCVAKRTVCKVTPSVLLRVACLVALSLSLFFLLWDRQINDWSVGGQCELHFSRTCPLSAGFKVSHMHCFTIVGPSGWVNCRSTETVLWKTRPYDSWFIF